MTPLQSSKLHSITNSTSSSKASGGLLGAMMAESNVKLGNLDAEGERLLKGSKKYGLYRDELNHKNA